MRNRVCGIILSVLSLVTSLGVAEPMAEFRGLYVDAFHPGIKNHEQVTQMVQAAKAANFNALIVQVRKRGDAYYNSHVEPKASDIAPDYDPLADVVQQAHAVGLEVHAWVSVYSLVLKGSQPDPTHVSVRHPEWTSKDADGKESEYSGTLYMDPGIPAARDYTVSIVIDIVKNYDIDGIHLDNLRYIQRESGYGEQSIALFNQENGRTGQPACNDDLWCQWRRQQITALVQKIQTTVNANRPRVKLSVSVIRYSPEVAFDYFLQDWPSWCKDGLVDFVIPMAYITTNSMATEAERLLKGSSTRHVYIGIGGYQISSDLAGKQVNDCRVAGTKGIVFYSYHYLGPNSQSGQCVRLSDLAGMVFGDVAAIPSMPWRSVQ